MYKDPQKQRDFQKIYQERYYQKNKSAFMKAARIRKADVRRQIDELKRAPCTDCGHQHEPYVMDFDHRDASTKLANVSTMITKQ